MLRDADINLWSDSGYASSGLHALLAGGDVDYSCNEDLWQALSDLVLQLRPHVPGHAAHGPPDDLESWLGF